MKIKVSDLTFIPVNFHPRHRMRVTNLVFKLNERGALETLLKGSKVLKFKGSLFACENFLLFEVLSKIHPNFTLDVVPASLDKTVDAERQVISYLSIQGVASLDAIEVPAFESAQQNHLPLFKVKEWAEILEVDRTTFFHHKSKFKPQIFQSESKAPTISLKDSLAGIPSFVPMGESHDTDE